MIRRVKLARVKLNPDISSRHERSFFYEIIQRLSVRADLSAVPPLVCHDIYNSENQKETDLDDHYDRPVKLRFNDSITADDLLNYILI